MPPREELEALRRLAELDAKEAAHQAAKDYIGGGEVDDAGLLTKVAGGAKHAWDKAAMGLQRSVPEPVQRGVAWLDEKLGMTPLKQEQIEQGKQFVNEAGTPATVGEIAADVAISAAPSTKAFQALKATGRAARALAPRLLGGGVATGLGTAAGVAGSGGATSALLAPEDKWDAAKGGAIWGLVGEGAGRAIGRGLGGALGRTTDEAADLMRQGVRVPVWKAQPEGGVVRRLGEAAKAWPVAGPMIKAREAQAVGDWSRSLVRDATPPVPVRDDGGRVLRWRLDDRVDAAGSEGLERLHRRFNDAYDALYQGRVVPLDDTFRSEMGDLVNVSRAYLPDVDAQAVEGAARRALDTLTGTEPTTSMRVLRQAGTAGRGKVSSRIATPQQTELVTEAAAHQGVTHGAVKQALDQIDASIRSAWNAGNADRAEALSGLREAIENVRSRGLPPEATGVKSTIDEAYAKYKTLQKAAATLGAQKRGGVASPQQMLNAIKARDKSPDKVMFAEGRAPGQRGTMRAAEVLGNELPDTGPGTAEKLLPLLQMGALTGGVSGLATMTPDLAALALLSRPGQRFLMGNYGPQEAMRRYSEHLTNALRNYGVARGND